VIPDALAPEASTTAAAAATTTVTTAMATTAARTAATATSATTVAITIASASARISSTFGARNCWLRRIASGVYAIKVGLVVGVKIGTAFDHRGGRALRCAYSCNWTASRRFFLSAVAIRRRRSATHFCALLFQDRFAR
jgi:hypothetical protein